MHYVFLDCVNLIDFSVFVPTVIIGLSLACVVFISVWYMRKKSKSSMCQCTCTCMYTFYLLLDQSFYFIIILF